MRPGEVQSERESYDGATPEPPPGFFDDEGPAPPPSSVTPGRSAPKRDVEHVGADAIFAPLPPVEWICEGLRFARGGGVACFGGYGYSGKTVVAQSVGLSVAAGRDVFGMFPVRQGRVLHLDYEQGSRLTYERYQRLARAMGITLADVDDRLRLAVFPSVYLDDSDAADVFARAFDGFDLVILDALRGAAPTIEENSSDVRRVLDLLARQSERSGALLLALLHARKPPSGPGKRTEGNGGEAKFSLRGSSAIFDALAELFVLSATKGEPTRVEHEKDRIFGVTLPDFGVRVEDVCEPGGPADPRWGLRVVHLDRAQLDAQPTPGGGELAKHAARIVSWLASKGGSYAGNKGALQDAIGMNRTAFFKAMSTLEGTRVRVEAGGKSTGARISLIPVVSV